jgi:uncharacterized protein YecT (DUF1311 family)
MKIILISFIILLSSLHANNIRCNPEGNQMQMNQCAYEDFLKEDKALNSVYKALRSKYKNDRSYLHNLKKSQKLWIKFRDRELDLIFTCNHSNISMCFGSMYPLLYNGEKATITKQRSTTLRKYLREEKY